MHTQAQPKRTCVSAAIAGPTTLVSEGTKNRKCVRGCGALTCSAASRDSGGRTFGSPSVNARMLSKMSSSCCSAISGLAHPVYSVGCHEVTGRLDTKCAACSPVPLAISRTSRLAPAPSAAPAAAARAAAGRCACRTSRMGCLLRPAAGDRRLRGSASSRGKPVASETLMGPGACSRWAASRLASSDLGARNGARLGSERSRGGALGSERFSSRNRRAIASLSGCIRSLALPRPDRPALQCAARPTPGSSSDQGALARRARGRGAA